MANETAQTLKALHTPSSPIVFTNVWDTASFQAVASLNTSDAQPVKAIATASWAIAASQGLKDEELTREQNLAAIEKIAALANAAGLPLSVDLQDGYGSQIAATVTEAVKLGAVGANIEDSIPATSGFYAIDEQVQRLKTALAAAAEAGCPDFVLNARSDIFHFDSGRDEAGVLKEAVARGKAFLEAGATTVFFWGGPGRGMRTAWVETLVKELDGRVAVILSPAPDALSVAELGQLGVARISIGPSLYRIAHMAMQKTAARILGGGHLMGQ